jgi:hypothetical protein
MRKSSPSGRPAPDELDGLRPMLRLPSLIIAALLLHAEQVDGPL